MSVLLSLLAGVLSTLSPCVLPILPIIVASALQQSWKGLVALVSGLALMFAITGSVVTYAAVAWGFDIAILRNISAVLLIGFALVLLVPWLNSAFTQGMSHLMQSSNAKVAAFNGEGLWGQFSLGALLALVWTPCVGPIMGSAMSLAIQGDSLLYSFIIMLGFGVGAAIPLLLIGLLGQRFSKNRQRIASTANKAKIVMGGVMLLLGIMVLTGMDKSLEIMLLDLMPEWLIDLTTAI